MPVNEFDAFRAELSSIKATLKAYTKKTVRDEPLIERIRLLYRIWVSTVSPSLKPLCGSSRVYLKLGNELDKTAQLTSKIKPVSEYLKRISTVLKLANSLVLYLPVSLHTADQSSRQTSEDLFVPGIPDVLTKWVPNSIVGWRPQMVSFTERYPFDNSVFIMIRYREHNDLLITSIKEELSDLNLNGIVAREHKLTDDLYNPIACLLACSRGIAVFDAAESSQEFNPNVAYELGMLHLLGRSCLILKDQTLEALHTDILMKLYVPYSTPEDAQLEVRKWIVNKET